MRARVTASRRLRASSLRTQLAEDVVEVSLDRPGRQVALGGDLAVGAPDRQQAVGLAKGSGSSDSHRWVNSKITFRFTGPQGLHRVHRFEALSEVGGCRLRHVLEGHTTSRMRLLWPPLYRPLHDALIEGARAQARSGRAGGRWPGWPPNVRARPRGPAGR